MPDFLLNHRTTLSETEVESSAALWEAAFFSLRKLRDSAQDKPLVSGISVTTHHDTDRHLWTVDARVVVQVPEEDPNEAPPIEPMSRARVAELFDVPVELLGEAPVTTEEASDGVVQPG